MFYPLINPNKKALCIITYELLTGLIDMFSIQQRVNKQIKEAITNISM